jgi:hypothetical protein
VEAFLFWGKFESLKALITAEITENPLNFIFLSDFSEIQRTQRFKRLSSPQK